MPTPPHPQAAMTQAPEPQTPDTDEQAVASREDPADARPAHNDAGLQPSRAEAPGQSGRETRRGGGTATAVKAAVEDHLLVAIFGPMIVLLLGYSLYTTNGRFGEISDNFGEINDRFIALEARIDRRFDAQDAKIDRRFERIDARFDAQDARIGALEARIDSLDARIGALEARIDSLDARIGALEARIGALEARIDSLDARIDEINLKLTTLIALLNKTDEVDAALAGEITSSTAPAVGSGRGQREITNPKVSEVERIDDPPGGDAPPP